MRPGDVRRSSELTILDELQAAIAALDYKEQLLLAAELDAELDNRRLEFYVPNAKQAEFLACGKEYRQRLLLAGNQTGKTLTAGAECSMHLTGRYPDWWVGRTFDKATVGWAAGVSIDALRDGVQRMLFGRTQRKTLHGFGTGMIPKDALQEKPSWRQHSNDVIDTAVVRHGGGGDVQAGHSLVVLKSYDQGREKFQSDTIDWAWLDEEPPYPIYAETLTRTNVKGGLLLCTFTPLMGRTKTVTTFLEECPANAIVIKMTLHDATHLTPERIAEMIAGYKREELEARVYGRPAMGEGRVFPYAREAVGCKPFKIPDHWSHIIGHDIGSSGEQAHPSANAWVVWDKDTDTMYVIATWRKRGATLSERCLALRAWGEWIPVAWPHDGLQHDKSGQSEKTIADQYRGQHVNMLAEHATHPPIPGANGKMEPGGYGLEAGIDQMVDMFLAGKLRVFEHLNDFWDEFEFYHRKDGLIVPISDDILSAVRYAIMMRRFAVKKPRAGDKHREKPPANWRTV